MNNKLNLLFEKLLSDKKFASKFIEQKSWKELYSFCISIVDGYSFEEFYDYVIEMIEFADKFYSESPLSKEQLNQISGGKITDKFKATSAVTASLIALSATPISAANPRKTSELNTTNISESIKSDETTKNEMSLTQKIKKTTKSILDSAKTVYKNHKLASNISAGAAAVSILGYSAHQTFKNKKEIPEDSQQQQERERLERERQQQLHKRFETAKQQFYSIIGMEKANERRHLALLGNYIPDPMEQLSFIEYFNNKANITKQFKTSILKNLTKKYFSMRLEPQQYNQNFINDIISAINDLLGLSCSSLFHDPTIFSREFDGVFRPNNENKVSAFANIISPVVHRELEAKRQELIRNRNARLEQDRIDKQIFDEAKRP